MFFDIESALAPPGKKLSHVLFLRDKKEGRNVDLEKRLFSPCAWSCLMRHFGHQVGILSSAGTPLLDYKRGVPVAQRPHWEGVGGKEKKRKKEKRRAYKSDNIPLCYGTVR
jgi:hypothetical protein